MRRLASRALTAALYSLAIVGVAVWDWDTGPWWRYPIRVAACTYWLWCAVTRTIQHREEDRE